MNVTYYMLAGHLDDDERAKFNADIEADTDTPAAAPAKSRGTDALMAAMRMPRK